MSPLVLGLVLFATVLPGPAAAGSPDKSKSKGKKKAEKVEVGVPRAGFSVVLRDHVRVYFVETHGKGKCPPGLAKKHNGCLPPGQAKKRYAVGHPLPPTIEILPVPARLEVSLGAPPSGYRYGVVDGDLVKLVLGTLLVVDAIDGLVE